MHTPLNKASTTNGQRPRRYPTTSKLTVSQRSVTAAFLVEQYALTVQQACDACCVNRTYVAKVKGMSWVDRFRVARGEIMLSPLVNARRKRREPTDAKVDRIVAKLGADRVLAALDRLTKPALGIPVNDNDDGAADWWKEAMAAE